MNEEHQKIKDLMQILNYLKTAGKANEFIQGLKNNKIKMVELIE